MKTLRSLLMALALMALFAVPAFAQDDTVTLGFEVTGAAGCPEDTTFFGLVGPPFSEFGGIQLQDEDGDGVFMGSTEVGAGEQLVVQIVQGVGTVDTEFGTFPGQPVTLLASFSSSEDPLELEEDRTLEAAADCDVPDNQQGGAGKTPDNQQDGDKEMVTKTFELTLSGDVPAGETFAVGLYCELKYNEGEGELLLFCSDSDDPSVPAGTEPCEGDGTTYRLSVELPMGDTLRTTFYRGFGLGPNTEAFHEVTETINADMTNTAYYTFGKGTGAGDDQETPDNQQDGDNKDSGAGEVPDDQQGEMPEELPDTGAGALAPGTAIPVGNAAAGLVMLAGAGYAVLRR